MKGKKKELSTEELQSLIRTQVAARIKALRVAKGHTSSEKFAIKNDIDRAQLGRYERGEVDMQIGSLVKILKALNVSIAEFFSEGFDDK
jgi:transcriptional regulator with XRE-family HTH domain